MSAPRSCTRIVRVTSGLALLLAASQAARGQYCPSYTASSIYNSGNCAVEAVAGTNPDTTHWLDAFKLVARGPASWGSTGPAAADLGQGCNAPTPPTTAAAIFPREILRAIGMVESRWSQFCIPTAPADQIGGPSRTRISFDCGYGVLTVKTGMHVGDPTVAFDRLRVAAEPTYALATGAYLLGFKWVAAPCVGDRQPQVLEDWYSALWLRSGAAYVNNPNNPNYYANRGVYDPAVNNAAPYQEKIYGWMEHPQGGLWSSVACAYPDSTQFAALPSPPALSEPNCASPTSCVSFRPTHLTVLGLPFADGLESGSMSAWTTQVGQSSRSISAIADSLKGWPAPAI